MRDYLSRPSFLRLGPAAAKALDWRKVGILGGVTLWRSSRYEWLFLETEDGSYRSVPSPESFEEGGTYDAWGYLTPTLK